MVKIVKDQDGFITGIENCGIFDNPTAYAHSASKYNADLRRELEIKEVEDVVEEKHENPESEIEEQTLTSKDIKSQARGDFYKDLYEKVIENKAEFNDSSKENK